MLPAKLRGLRKEASQFPWGIGSTRSFLTWSPTENRNDHQIYKKESEDCTMQFDFFGEPVTFRLGKSQTSSFSDSLDQATRVSHAMAAHDAFQLAVVSKGKTCWGGNDEAGLLLKSAHSCSISWAEAIRYAAHWNPPTLSSSKIEESPSSAIPSAPMLVVPIAGPLLAHAGSAYVRHLDTFLEQANTSEIPYFDHKLHLIELTEIAVARKNDTILNQRESLHLEALEYLLYDESRKALATYFRIIRLCPGDVLALSIAMDLAHKLSDSSAALRIAGSVASYWRERQGGFITPALPGQTLATGIMAVGFAAAGYMEEAEHMLEVSMKQARKASGALGSWGKALVYDSRGRVAEGISALANFDGVALYEGSGLFFFERRLGGYGARFAMDREERGRGKSQALRLYESSIEQLLEYSGYSIGKPWESPKERAPGKYLLSNGEGSFPQKMDQWRPTLEDVLVWMPPTVPLLTDATLLLLRLTLNGTVSTNNRRWESISKAWTIVLDVQKRYKQDLASNGSLACLAMSIFLKPEECGGDKVGNGRIAHALHLLGQKLQLGNVEHQQDSESVAVGHVIRDNVAESAPSFWLPESDQPQVWKEIVDSIVEEMDYPNGFPLWEFDSRPIIEHTLTYAACKAGDIESLSTARAVCSQAVTLRPNSPEVWWRYSIVLGLLGDVRGSEDALIQSINVGAGQGAR